MGRKRVEKDNTRTHKTVKREIGEIKYWSNTNLPYSSGSYISPCWQNQLGLKDYKWLITIDDHDGKVLPAQSSMYKLLAQGFIKLSLTEKGKEELTRAKSSVIIHQLKKIKLR